MRIGILVWLGYGAKDWGGLKKGSCMIDLGEVLLETWPWLVGGPMVAG